MNITFQKVKSLLYVLAWTLLVAVVWFLWLSALQYLLTGDYIFVLGFGIFVGIVSGLSPNKVFLVCFAGFFIIAPLGLFFSIFEDLAFFSILCGLFGIAGAVLRRMLFRRGIEELYLKSWEWVLLIGGVSAVADYLTIPSVYSEIFIYYRLTVFFKYFVSVSVGLFALGLYTGMFYHQDYKNLMKSIVWVSLGGHGVFLMYMGYLYATRHTSWESFLFVPLIGVFLLFVLKGAQIGYHSRDRFGT